MSRINDIFAKQRERCKKTHIAYITPEYPYRGMTVELALALAQNNVHIIELGIPFSDPLADGPVIQKSSSSALQHNVDIPMVLDHVRAIRAKSEVGLVLMTYINPVLAFSSEHFFKQAAQAGIDGVIIPDLPVDEADTLVGQSRQSGIDLIFLAAPTSPDERLEKIASHSRTFIYCVTITGVTGVQKEGFIDQAAKAFLLRVREKTSLPLAAGFGLSSPADLKALREYCDGFIVGSALIRALEQGSDSKEAIEKGLQFIGGLFKD